MMVPGDLVRFVGEATKTVMVVESTSTECLFSWQSNIQVTGKSSADRSSFAKTPCVGEFNTIKGSDRAVYVYGMSIVVLVCYFDDRGMFHRVSLPEASLIDHDGEWGEP